MRKNRRKPERIILGLSASVAVYKSCYLTRLLLKRGYKVKVIMTPNATRLISPLLLESLSGEPVYVDTFKRRTTSLEHISLAEWADLLILAPASANTISKLSKGICDNLLTTVVFALFQDRMVLVAPAMNSNMWNNPIIRSNVNFLKSLPNFKILEPRRGILACGREDIGVMVEPEEILKEIQKR